MHIHTHFSLLLQHKRQGLFKVLPQHKTTTALTLTYKLQDKANNYINTSTLSNNLDRDFQNKRVSYVCNISRGMEFHKK